MSGKSKRRQPKASDPATTDLEQLAEEARLRAWFRSGVHETVQKLRHDKGFQRAVAEHAREILIGKRARLLQGAMNAALRNRPTFERNLREGKGIWFDEMEPLAPKERGLVLEKLKEVWDIPERIERPVLA